MHMCVHTHAHTQHNLNRRKRQDEKAVVVNSEVKKSNLNMSREDQPILDLNSCNLPLFEIEKI